MMVTLLQEALRLRSQPAKRHFFRAISSLVSEQLCGW